jgi:hypothetical protein
VRHRENGSVFPVGNPEALATELAWWAEHPTRTTDNFTWTPGAQTLISESEDALRR